MARIKFNASRLSSEDLLTLSRNIVTMMTGNPVYITLQGDLPALAAACDALAAVDQEVLFHGGKLAYERKRICVQEVGYLVNELAHRVAAVSGGDTAKILSAGFHVRKEPEAPQTPHAPKGVTYERTGFEDSIKLRWEPQRNVRFHHVQCQQVDGSWVLVGTTTRCSIILSGLEPGKLFTFRVVAFSALGAGPNSGEVTVRAAA